MSAPPGKAGVSERLPELDALRGIAAFVVLVFHTHHVIGGGRPPVRLEDYRLLYILATHSPLRPFAYGREAVLFFFILSGYVLTRSLLRSGSPGLVAFAAQRSLRLGLPVVATVLLSALLYRMLVTPAAHRVLEGHALATWSGPPTSSEIVRNIGLIGADFQLRLDPTLWSLVHEWRLTVLMPLVLLFRHNVWLLLALAAMLTAFGLAGGAVENEVLLGPHLRSTIPATCYFALPFAIGAAVAIAVPAQCLAGRQRLTAGTAAAALLSMQSDVAAYAGSALLILLAQERPQGEGWLPRLLRRRPLVGLGRISFSLYLVHLPVLAACLAAFYTRLPIWGCALLGALASILAALLLNSTVERPAQRLARRVEARLESRSHRSTDTIVDDNASLSRDFIA
jgi:peptidoglycan/LPS O-acetylase OafA/YrhL